ncbi:DUF1700 domain-containing protein [Brevibacillus humidisoli]|uniref:HAAS signaling domain-containing protein n=1 Tax=Brevibacillus humidisoli TaxID=2895522 RepID=UPI001E388A0A|nr:DUF1700 domain-containing protein [Brevibacillus humidisoli]UFJ39658.1 DUF1700 domain-containing protein [Brevibacillus humidisoli]
MTRDEFLWELEQLLKDLPEIERQDILMDYKEHFYNALESGKDDEEIIRSLGSPKVIAKELKANYHIHRAQTQASVRSVGRAIIATLSLGLFNLLLVAGPAIGIVAVLLGLYATTLALLAAPFGLLVGYLWTDHGFELLDVVFPMMAIGGLGVMMAVGMIYLTRWVGRLFVSYLRFNLKMIRG